MASGWCACVALALAACGDPVQVPQQSEPLAQFFLAPAANAVGPMLLVSRFEVTRAEYAAETDRSLAELPAVGMTRSEAQAWCAERGLRLPTRIEWMHLRIAGGQVSREVDRANTLELNLGKALPVGAIQSGRTGLGGYDFEGNVWEWLADDAVDGSEQSAFQAGGSFANYRLGPRDAALRQVRPDDRASDVGFRPVVEALEWLEQKTLPRWRSADAEELARMQQALADWGPELRLALVRRWRQAYPQETAFADFLAGDGESE